MFDLQRKHKSGRPAVVKMRGGGLTNGANFGFRNN